MNPRSCTRTTSATNTSTSPSYGTSLSAFRTVTTAFCAMRSGKAPSRPSLSPVMTKFVCLLPPASPVCGLPIRSSPAFVDLFSVKKVSVLVISNRGCLVSGTSTSASKLSSRLMSSDALRARTRSPRACRLRTSRHLSQRGRLPLLLNHPLSPLLTHLTWVHFVAFATITSAVPLVLSR